MKRRVPGVLLSICLLLSLLPAGALTAAFPREAAGRGGAAVRLSGVGGSFPEQPEAVYGIAGDSAPLDGAAEAVYGIDRDSAVYDSTAEAVYGIAGDSAPLDGAAEAVYGIDENRAGPEVGCTRTEGCSLPKDHEGDCVLYAARYQKTKGGKWFYGTLKEATRKVYAGGTVEVLRDVELDTEPQEDEPYYYKIIFRKDLGSYEPGSSETKVEGLKEDPGIIVTKPMTIASAGDTRHTITYSPKGKGPNYNYSYILDCLINAFPINALPDMNTPNITYFYHVTEDVYDEIEGNENEYVKIEGDEYVKINNKYVKVVRVEYDERKCELCLENIILDGGWRDDSQGNPSQGALVYIENGKLILGDGAIIQNNDTMGNSAGAGGLHMKDGGKVVMESGSVIRKCRANSGGGASVSGLDASLTLEGGIIQDCEAYKGGGVYIQRGSSVTAPNESKPEGGSMKCKLYLKSGAIRCNKAIAKDWSTGWGGGICTEIGEVHLSGGVITENHAGHYGGGVYVSLENRGLRVDGVTIDGLSEVILSGTPVVKGNTSTDDCFYNVYLEGSGDSGLYSVTPMTIEAPLTDGAFIGVSRWDGPDAAHPYRVVARPADRYTITPEDLSNFYSDDYRYVTLLHNNLDNPTDPDNGAIVITHADVAFDTQGHGECPPSQLIDETGKVAEPEVPTAPGYTFVNWNTEPECANEWNFTENQVTTDVKPQVLYANWDLNHYKIEYDLGYVEDNSLLTDYTVESPTIDLKDLEDTDKYEFTGWKLTALDEDRVNSLESLHPASRSGRSVRADLSKERQDGIPSGSIGYRKFTALWRQLPPYKVTYTDGVENGEVFPDQVTEVLRENTSTPAFRGGAPTRPGYTFKGWKSDVNPTVIGIAPTVTEDVTYTAQWEENAVPKPPDPPGGGGGGGGGGDSDSGDPPAKPDPAPGEEPPQDPGAELPPGPGTEPAPGPGEELPSDPGTDPGSQPEPAPKPEPDHIPQTGDPTHTALWAGCALASLAGIVLALRPQRRRR